MKTLHTIKDGSSNGGMHTTLIQEKMTPTMSGTIKKAKM